MTAWTDAEILQMVAESLNSRAQLDSVKERGDAPFLTTIADMLQSYGDELAGAEGNFGSCDEPGAIKTGLKIARAYLGEA